MFESTVVQPVYELEKLDKQPDNVHENTEKQSVNPQEFSEEQPVTYGSKSAIPGINDFDNSLVETKSQRRRRARKQKEKQLNAEKPAAVDQIKPNDVIAVDESALSQLQIVTVESQEKNSFYDGQTDQNQQILGGKNDSAPKEYEKSKVFREGISKDLPSALVGGTLGGFQGLF